MITDPLGNAWIDPSGNEDGDLCISTFGPALGGGARAYNETIDGGRYYLQEEWSNDNGGCATRDEADHVSFSAPHQLHAGRRGRFHARARDPDGSIVGYTWFFGDGRHAGGRTNRHKFRHAGTYRVALRVTDSSGNWAFAARTVRVL
jgi:PKD domain